MIFLKWKILLGLRRKKNQVWNWYVRTMWSMSPKVLERQHLFWFSSTGWLYVININDFSRFRLVCLQSELKLWYNFVLCDLESTGILKLVQFPNHDPSDKSWKRIKYRYLLVFRYHLNPKKGGLQKSLKRGGGNNAHRPYMVFRTLEWVLRPS